MNEYMENRIIEEAEYILTTKATIRKTAKLFGVSKSTTHRDIAKRLPVIDYTLFKNVYPVLKINGIERAARGGESTRLKYLKLKQ